jgi:hypothetical protein
MVSFESSLFIRSLKKEVIAGIKRAKVNLKAALWRLRSFYPQILYLEVAAVEDVIGVVRNVIGDREVVHDRRLFTWRVVPCYPTRFFFTLRE